MTYKISNPVLPGIRLFTLLALTLALIQSCDTRKDIIPALEQSESAAPVIQVRRHSSGLPFVSNFKDTVLLGISGYRLDFSVSGNADLSTLNFSCVTGCVNLSYSQVKQDSGFVLLYISNGTSATFTFSVSNKFGQSSSAYFSLAAEDEVPSILIRNSNYTLSFAQILTDTIKTAVSPVYSIEYVMSGSNLTYSNVVVKRMNLGDATPFSIGSHINFNFSGVVIPSTYGYKIYVVDPLGKVSDTCSFQIYAFRDLPPVFDGLVSATSAAVSVQATDTYLQGYEGGGGPTWFAWPSSITFNAHEAEQRFGGFIQTIRWRIRFYNNYDSKTFDQSFSTIYASSNTSFTLTFDSPWYTGYMSWLGVPTTVLFSGSLIDNTNDSTVFYTTVTF